MALRLWRFTAWLMADTGLCSVKESGRRQPVEEGASPSNPENKLELPSEKMDAHSSAACMGAGLPVAHSAKTELSNAPATSKAVIMASFRNTQGCIGRLQGKNIAAVEKGFNGI